MKTRTYLDWAAAAPAGVLAMKAFIEASKDSGNPASPHTEGREAKDRLEDARVRVARLSGVKQDAVLFTAGATEANALAIKGFIHALKDQGRTPSLMHVLYLPSAHASTRGAIAELEREGMIVEPLILTEGRIDLATLLTQIRPETVLVAMEAVCGETGTRFDTRGVRQVLDKTPSKVRLHVDASQLPLVESFERTRLAADTVTLDSQKIGGVRGIGVLLAPRQLPLMPLFYGGGQERGLRPGTPSGALAAAFAVALEEAQEGCVVFALRARGMRERLIDRVIDSLSDIEVNEGKEQAPHILNLSLLGRDTDYVAALLDEAGFAVSTRSACATDEEGSVAIMALTQDARRASSTLRISWGPKTPERDLERFYEALVRAVRFVDANTL